MHLTTKRLGPSGWLFTDPDYGSLQCGEHAWTSPNFWRSRLRTKHPTCIFRRACRR
ncbi:hypothetical protein [Lysobacter gummosus]|uniref:hypothetical protein n=1 Tax=Lysobacter gummosus TaxID=262324 RepID=UPI003625E71F